MAAKVTDKANSCEICGSEGLGDEELRNHVLQHLGVPIKCPLCDLSDVSYDEMLVHVNTTHLDYLTPSNEYFSFIDDDDDDDDSSSQEKLMAAALPKFNGWAEKANVSASYHQNNNNNELVAGCSNTQERGSPLRSQLNLNLQPRSNRLRESERQQCPMCAHSSCSPAELEEHINRVHFDPTSPSFQPSTSNTTTNRISNGKDSYHHCPFCIECFYDSPDLELHVNLEHKDILSPNKVEAIGGAARLDDWSVQCPVCCRSKFQSNKDMVAHIEGHFNNGASPNTPITPDSFSFGDRLLAKEMEKREKETRRAREQREFEMLRAQYGMDNQGNFKEQSLTNMQKAVYAGEMSVADYYERQVELRQAEYSGVDDGSSCTKGLVTKIRTISSGAASVVENYLCTTVDHYASTYGDKGWGCGYRNVQMLVSSLLHHTGYNEQLYKPAVVGAGLFGADSRACYGRNAVPSISRLQQHIEWAWQQGFDVQGAEQLDGKLHNTRKWIGATEVVTAFSSLRISCQLVDFHQPTSPDGSHPELFAWVLRYFQQHQQKEFTPPLYLQHQGHSRTIVGIESHKDGHLTLLLFDPSHTPEQMAQLRCATGNVAGMRLVRKTLAAMKARQYQLVGILGVMATEREYEPPRNLNDLERSHVKAATDIYTKMVRTTIDATSRHLRACVKPNWGPFE